MNDNAADASFAAWQRRQSRREEFAMQTNLAELLAEYLDPHCVFWGGLENAPRSLVSGIFQKRGGIRSGLPDLIVAFQVRYPVS
jgi:hypothetical protein